MKNDVNNETHRDAATLDEAARNILRSNDRGGYTVPTEGLYPYQWNWDSVFAAWGFAQFDVDRAWTEIETLLASQWPSGMVPHILFHQVDAGYFPGPDVWDAGGKGPVQSSGITQPPIAASFVRRIFDARPSDRARALFPKLKAWHRWFMQWRCDQGAIFITHPWESGRDNAADWDSAMQAIDPVGVGTYTRRDTSHVDPSMRPTKEDYDRYVWLVQRGARLGWDDSALAKNQPFAVADPSMTLILLRANRDLAALADAFGQDRREIDAWTAQLEAGADRLRNPKTGVFDSINLLTGQHAGTVSSASFLCWYAGLQSDVMLAELAAAFAQAKYPVPSLKVGSDEFDARRYWRGPTWAIINTLIGLGLEDAGHRAQAAELRRRTAEMITQQGFAEYHNPLDGAPGGGASFTWTAAIWLAWASPNAQQNAGEH